MSNFAFLPDRFSAIGEAARRAEGHVYGDPRAACFHARFGLEAMVHWLYRHDPALRMPYDQKLGALIHEPSFQNLLPPPLFHKARLVLKVGNLAVHQQRKIHQSEALQSVKDLHFLCYWLVRTYAPEVSRAGAAFSDERVPRPIKPEEVVSRSKLEVLEKQLAEQNEATLRRQRERDALDAELQELRAQIAEIRAESETRPLDIDLSEADTRRLHIDISLRLAGWGLDGKHDREYEVTGMPNEKGIGYADYVLWGDDGKPLAVVEAKRSTVDPTTGRQQAKLYADCLEAMHGQRPVIFYTNGYQTWMWDDQAYPPREVAGFYSKADLERLVLRRKQRQSLAVAKVDDDIAGRYYQKRAIAQIFEQFASARRKALLVMATGTGKTRTAIALVDALQRAGWAKRALFLADRVSLVNQAVGAFKAHLPDSSPVNLVTEKDKQGRVYACTYPTMMNLIDATQGGEARFGVGHFDLVIIDEAHRSVYQKFGAIFRYFDSLLVGLTATPREEVDRNTYELFDLEPGVPTDAYELDQAVSDGFLVPPKAEIVDLKFPREGIHYDELSEDEKAEWESLDWGDDVDEAGLPRQVNAAAVNRWLFNQDTVDKVLQHLMEHGHHVEGGDRLAKTIIFARNHDHAEFIAKRFDHHYPHVRGSFARVIDNRIKYAQSLIDDFSDPDKPPHIAISVDMLDTGIDVPEVANLVFFKPVYSKIKFWQMIGRGTRLSPDLFGPGEDKQDFRVFDFCFNFDFFRENPLGIEANAGAPLGERLFRARVDLLTHLQATPELDPDEQVHNRLIDTLHGQVNAMNHDNFIVRMHLEAVERFNDLGAWQRISDSDRQVLHKEIAGLPSEQPVDDIESRLFDLTALRLQLALTESDTGNFERQRKRVVEIAGLLEEKTSVPAVKQQLGLLSAVQESEWWEGTNITLLEDLRIRLRDLVPLLERKERQVVYTNFQDEVRGVREEDVVPMPKMTGAQYEKKVRDYLKNHTDHLVIHRLRTNQPLTETDLKGLEQTLAEIGDDDGPDLLNDLLERNNAPSLAWFVRSLVGMDRTAAQQAFANFLNDRSLTPDQIRFVELIIDQLTARGVIPPEALYEPPFTRLHHAGPDELFTGKEDIIEAVFDQLQAVHQNIQAKAG
jgi:type I restriction enzyme, R subunit